MQYKDFLPTQNVVGLKQIRMIRKGLSFIIARAVIKTVYVILSILRHRDQHLLQLVPLPLCKKVYWNNQNNFLSSVEMKQPFHQLEA
jgi:hypothetical protein